MKKFNFISYEIREKFIGVLYEVHMDFSYISYA